MKTIRVLNVLISIYYYLMVLAFIAGCIMIPLSLFINQPIEMNIFGHQFSLANLPLFQVLIIVPVIFIVLGLFVRLIWFIKTTTKELETGHYFSELVIANFKKIGKLFILCGIGFFILNFILKLFIESELFMGVDSSLFIFIITGLFFMFLSEIFKKANNLEQENDLTI